jgi:hypothetical protein
MRTKLPILIRCLGPLTAALLLAFLVGMSPQPASAQGVDTVTSACTNAAGAPQCTVFQLDGSQTAVPNGDTCVSGESICPVGEQNPSWPADWDALFFPGLTANGAAGVPIISGAAPAAYSFGLPWNAFGSFSGAITSTLVTTGISTILKQGSKNNNDISSWVVATQSSPPKDAYLAGTIADYIAPPGSPIAKHQLVYLGSTRFAPNGSATIGIWFFQQNVEVCQTGPNAGTKFCVKGTQTLATHQNKDLFLFLTFSGSGNATIVPAEWQSGSLVQNSALITCPNSNAQGCAVTNNTASITLGDSTGHGAAPGTGFNVHGSGWAGFPGGVVPINQFQETGVDFNAIFGGTAPCFSSVMFASVSSGSSPGTASLKSILLGSFNTCAITVGKTCGAGTANAANGTIKYPISGTVENVGGGTVSNLSLTDSFNNAPQALDSGSLTCTCGASGCTVNGSDCSSVNLNPGGTVTYNATITSTSNGGSDVVTATMAGGGGGSATAQSPTAQCLNISFSSAVSITKSCTPGATLVAKSNLVAVEVQVGGTVTNGDAGGLDLTNVTVEECIGGTFATIPPATALNPCPTIADITCSGTLVSTVTTEPSSTVSVGTPSAWSDTYFPTVAPSCPFTFNDQVLVTATCASKFCACPTVQNVASASCPLCPAGGTCQ